MRQLKMAIENGNNKCPEIIRSDNVKTHALDEKRPFLNCSFKLGDS